MAKDPYGIDFSKIFDTKDSTWDKLADALTSQQNIQGVFTASRDRKINSIGTQIDGIDQLVDSISSPDQLTSAVNQFNNWYPSASQYSETMMHANAVRNKLENKKKIMDDYTLGMDGLQDYMSRNEIIDTPDEFTRDHIFGDGKFWAEPKNDDGTRKYKKFSDYIFHESVTMENYLNQVGQFVVDEDGNEKFQRYGYGRGKTFSEDNKLVNKALRYKLDLEKMTEALYMNEVLTDEELWFLKNRRYDLWDEKATQNKAIAADNIKTGYSGLDAIDEEIRKLNDGDVGSINWEMIGIDVNKETGMPIETQDTPTIRAQFNELRKFYEDQVGNGEYMWEYWEGTPYDTGVTPTDDKALLEKTITKYDDTTVGTRPRYKGALDEYGYSIDPTTEEEYKKRGGKGPFPGEEKVGDDVGAKGDDKLIDETKPLSEQLGIETVDVEADKDTVRPWAATHIEKIGNEVNELKLQIDGFEFGQEFIGSKVDVSAAKQLNKFLGRPTTNDKIKYKDLEKIGKIIENDKVELNKLYEDYLSMKKIGIKKNDPTRKNLQDKINQIIQGKYKANLWHSRRGNPIKILEEQAAGFGHESKILSFYNLGLARIQSLTSQHDELLKKYNKDLKNVKPKTEN